MKNSSAMNGLAAPLWRARRPLLRRLGARILGAAPRARPRLEQPCAAPHRADVARRQQPARPHLHLEPRELGLEQLRLGRLARLHLLLAVEDADVLARRRAGGDGEHQRNLRAVTPPPRHNARLADYLLLAGHLIPPDVRPMQRCVVPLHQDRHRPPLQLAAGGVPKRVERGLVDRHDGVRAHHDDGLRQRLEHRLHVAQAPPHPRSPQTLALNPQPARHEDEQEDEPMQHVRGER
mmetsp:Transcript_8450/g.26873  ORF Transcript_8450/g.26873 Transcript_8450/m.26873 type:complete len:236 (-) Transcript_8450:96-803(-)